MKKILLFCFALFMCNFLFAQISRDGAFNIVKANVLNNDYQSKNILASKSLTQPSETLKVLSNVFVSPNYESWFFFVDDTPFANSGLGRYVFVNSLNGSISIQNNMFPPSIEMDILHQVAINHTVRTERVVIERSEDACTSENNYAVIISGGGSLWSNWVRYWNDCSAIFTILVNKYHFDKSKIFVLMSDGTDPAADRIHYDGHTDSSPLDLDGDGMPDIKYAATKADIAHVFNTLSKIITSNEHVFIFTTDHGGYGSTLVLWEDEMSSAEFATEVNKVNSAKSINVVMEQCYSGGYTTALAGNNRVISTACASYELSWAMGPDYYYNEYVYHWMSAVLGEELLGGMPVHADYNVDGVVTMDEAFQYAESADMSNEAPQYSGGTVGNILSLVGFVPTIYGNNEISSCGENTYYVNDISCATYLWECSSNITIVSGQGSNSISVLPNSSGVGWIKVTIDVFGFIFETTKNNIIISPQLFYPLYVNYSTLGNLTISSPIVIGGDFVINNSHTVRIINTNVFATPDAQIIVRPGGTLIVDNGTINTACEDKKWQGVVVEGCYLCPLPYPTPGLVHLRKGSAIINAGLGIHAINGGEVEATNASFTNNRVAAHIDMYASGNFTSCKFSIDDDFYGNPYSFPAQLILSNSKDIVNVLGCEFLFAVTRYPESFTTAISAFNSSLNVTNSQKGTPTTISNFRYGISASNTGTLPTLFVGGCKFSNNLYGINIDGVYNPSIRNNDFKLSRTGSYGLKASESTRYFINNNRFISTDKTLQTRGIVISKSGTGENIIHENYFRDLNIGIQAIDQNSSQCNCPWQVAISGLQFLCNDFDNTQQTDILVGSTANPPYLDHSVRRDQGEPQLPSGNEFLPLGQNRINISNFSNYPIYYYFSVLTPTEYLYTTTGTAVNKIQLLLKSDCLPLSGKSELSLSQYDEWNMQYEYWYSRLLAFEGDSEEEYNLLYGMVSYYSALKDNYFNEIIMTTMYDETPERGDNLYNNLRYLFSYRNNYTDNLSIVETYLAENNFKEALSSVTSMYQLFEVTEEDIMELLSMETYIKWLQQLANDGKNIYMLSPQEVDELVKYVDTHIGRSVVYAKNILCVLYDVCFENEVPISASPKNQTNEQSPKQIDYKKLLDKISVIPNPTTGELRITNYKLTRLKFLILQEV